MNMRLISKSPSILRWLLPVAFLIACGSIALAQTTTFAGTVYSPNGPPPGLNGIPGDPIPNILVFVVAPGYPPPAFTQGVTLAQPGQNGCAIQPDLVPGQVLGSAITGFDGTFNFTVAGPLPAPNVTLVIQAGKWRRQYTYATTSLNLGGTNTFNSLAMPPAQGVQPDGSIADLPYIAVVTGQADGIECIFRQIGISDSEVSGPGGVGHIQLYPADGGGQEGATYPGSTTAESTLTASAGALSAYDLVMFGCQGSPEDQVVAADANNLTAYTNSGGRIFATHYEYVWLQDNSTFNPSANGWMNNLDSYASELATINTSSSFTEGTILANWMNYIGALASNPPPVVDLTNVRINTSGINPAISQSWASLNIDPSASMQFTFDTPIGNAGTPSVAVTYNNSSSPYLTGDTADNVTVNVTNGSAAALDDTLVLNITLPSGLNATSAVDSAGAAAGWTCTTNSNIVICKRLTTGKNLPVGASDSVIVTFSIPSAMPVGGANITASLSGDNLTNDGKCGRVLYNDYHVEEPAGGAIPAGENYPLECPATSVLSGVQKFLEFSLYNLSSFISSTSTDTLNIQGVPVLSWTNPLPTIFYGTVPYTTVVPTATYEGTTLAGTWTYSPALADILPIGPDQKVCAFFSPSDAIDYIAPSSPICTEITVYGTGFLMQVNPTAMSVGVGNSATATISIVPSYMYTQTVQLTCSGLPNEATCNFAQGLVPAGGGTTTLTVNVAAPHACGTSVPYFIAASGTGTTLPLAAFSALGLFLLRKRKRIFRGLTLVLALCLLPLLNGCASNCTDLGTQPGTYTFTVTATAGGAVGPNPTPQVTTQTMTMVVHL